MCTFFLTALLSPETNQLVVLFFQIQLLFHSHDTSIKCGITDHVRVYLKFEFISKVALSPSKVVLRFVWHFKQLQVFISHLLSPSNLCLSLSVHPVVRSHLTISALSALQWLVCSSRRRQSETGPVVSLRY